jgi:hypothetical protein
VDAVAQHLGRLAAGGSHDLAADDQQAIVVPGANFSTNTDSLSSSAAA